jgi:hypothetical protein
VAVPTPTSVSVFDDLLRLDLTLCYHESYDRIGRFWQVVATGI